MKKRKAKRCPQTVLTWSDTVIRVTYLNCTPLEAEIAVHKLLPLGTEPECWQIMRGHLRVEVGP